MFIGLDFCCILEFKLSVFRHIYTHTRTVEYIAYLHCKRRHRLESQCMEAGFYVYKYIFKFQEEAKFYSAAVFKASELETGNAVSQCLSMVLIQHPETSKSMIL